MQKYSAWEMRQPNGFVVESVPLLRKNKCKRILDIGCGTGRHTVYLAKKGFFVIGLDISEEALEKTKKWAAGVRNCYFVKADMERLPFTDGYFDAVLSIVAIEHARIGKIRRTLKEIHRVLRKGGIFLVQTESDKDRPVLSGKRIAPHTRMRGGKVHYFFNRERIGKEFSLFWILDAKEVSDEWFGAQRVLWQMMCKKA